MKLHETNLRNKTLLQRIPRYAWACLLIMAAAQLLVFYGTRILLVGRVPHDMSIALDHRIPVIPAWTPVYFLAFPVWIGSLLWILSESRQRAFHIAGAYLIVLLIALVMFVAYPSTIVWPEITGDGMFPSMLRLLYRLDTPQNLFPSLHVITCYFCWRGTMGSKTVPPWFAWCLFLFLILTCFCILFVKQHVLVDIPAGIIVGELAIQIARLTRIERLFFAAEERIHTSRE